MRTRGVLTAGFALLFSLTTGPIAAAWADPSPSPSPTSSSKEDEGEMGNPPDQVDVPPVSTLAAPSFQLPFPCGQTWTGNSSASSAHKSYEIDFNRG
ncbi:M23 family peptidase, partial [Nonomuraea angiospora]